MTLKLKNFLDSQQSLRQLSGKLLLLRNIQSAYEQIVPANLQRASEVMNIEHGVLTLSANNGTVAAKLRQMTPELLERLKLQGCEVTGIQVRVQVTLTPPPHATHPASLGPNGKLQIGKLADSMEASPLKSALQRLLQSGRTK